MSATVDQFCDRLRDWLNAIEIPRLRPRRWARQAGADQGFWVDGAMPGRGALPVRHDVVGHVPGHLRPHDAAVRPVDDHGAAPLLMLSGGMTPRESMPEWVQQVMLAAPTTHFVILAQGILYRGAGVEAVWPQFLALVVIGTVLFNIALARFRRTIGTMA